MRPIQDDVDLANAQSVADKLAVIDKRTADQDDYLETLSLLIEKYEEEHHSIEASDLDALGTLRFLLGQHGMNASDLGRMLGNRQLGAAILRGDRGLSKANILKIASHFGVNPGVFLTIKRGKR